MPESSDNPLGYADAFESYWHVTWRGVLPMRRGHKVWPPSVKCRDARKPGHDKDRCPNCISYTGYNGIWPSYPDVMSWAESFPDGNLCLRLPNDDEIAIVGVDVDAYGAKTGAAAFEEAQRRWGPLPANAPRSSSREGNLISGIRLFQVPPGTTLATKVGFPELGIGDIEIVQRHHRYVIAWPSVHPEGGLYCWRNDADDIVPIPDPRELPWLPQAWIDGLKVVPQSQFDGPIDFSIQQALTPGEPSPKVAERMQLGLRELQRPGASRHDTCTRHVMALARLGKSGEPGVKKALQLLCDVLIAVRQVDQSDTPEGTRLEFIRMLTNDNIARELSRPGVTDWIGALISDEVMAEIRAEAVAALEAEKQNAASEEAAPDVHPQQEKKPPETTRPTSRLEEIEQGFWESRESLAMVYQTAMARMSPPWAVLAICAARALTSVRPHVTLPPIIGGPGSLNWFAALIADSAGGKTTSAAAAESLVRYEIEECNAGSGEGIIAAFGRPQDDSDPTPERESIMFNIDEIDTLAAMSGRSGSTTLPILRSGFSGATLGFSYAAKDKRRHIRRHTYRMTVVIGMQPERTGWLLADAGGGTPQRFMWFPTKDARISRDRPWEAGPLKLPPLSEWLYPREIRIPKEAEDLIIDEQVKRQRGEVGALDGHAIFCREKFAYALAVLDGRVFMTLEDWQLSGIAAEVSMYTRDKTVEAVETAAHMGAIDRGELKGVENASANVGKMLEEMEQQKAALRWVIEKVGAAEEEGVSRRDLMQRAGKRTRVWLDWALEHGAGDGLIRPVEGTTLWVKV